LYWTGTGPPKKFPTGVGCICETLHYFLVKSSHVVYLHACTAEVLFILVMRVLIMVCVCKNVHIRRNEVLEHVTASARICQRICPPLKPQNGGLSAHLSLATPVRSLDMKDKAICRSLELKRVEPRDRANFTSLIFCELGLMTSPTSPKFWNSKMACCQHLGVDLPTCITCIRRPWRRRHLHCRSCNMPQDLAPAKLFLFVSNTPYSSLAAEQA
jgi:hypothetical protein